MEGLLSVVECTLLSCRKFGSEPRLTLAAESVFPVLTRTASGRTLTQAYSMLHAVFNLLAAVARDGSFFESHRASTDGSKQREPPITRDGIFRFSASRYPP